MSNTRDYEREAALKEHINALSPNLLRSYLCTYVTDAAVAVIDRLIVALKATHRVPAKDGGEQ